MVGETSSTATLSVVDKLCSGITDREVFFEEYDKPIDEHIEKVRAERVASGEGSHNRGAIRQEVQNKLWKALPSEIRDEMNKKAQMSNSDTKR